MKKNLLPNLILIYGGFRGKEGTYVLDDGEFPGFALFDNKLADFYSYIFWSKNFPSMPQNFRPKSTQK